MPTTKLDTSDQDTGPQPPGPLLDIKDLRTYLFTRWGTIRAVDGVDLQLHEGETLGIVGESGSGKSMLGLSMVRLTPDPVARFVSGEINFQGSNLLDVSESEMRRIRGEGISMIFQDPQQSLNPVFTVGSQVKESIRQGDPSLSRAQVHEQAIEALRSVSVPEPEQRLKDYPHELSGGMKQRIVSAMVMIREPRILVADEPTTALDVTIQAQFLALLSDLQARTNVSLVLITHDFGVVAHMCDRVAVMYAGRIVEEGPVQEIFDDPRHPYTRALLAARPKPDMEQGHLRTIEGQPPSLSSPPAACRFEPRCEFAVAQCAEEYPAELIVGPKHAAWCWRSEEQPWNSH